MIYNQIVTWTAFAILAMFYITHVFDVFASYGGEGCGLEGNRLGTKNANDKKDVQSYIFLEWHI